MFRRSVELPGDCHAVRMRIKASFHYLVYVNGTLVTRGPARSYDFCKAFDTVDLRLYLLAGQTNVIAILAPGAGAESPNTIPHPLGILAELNWQDASGTLRNVATDRQWKVCRHDAFKRGAAGWNSNGELLLGREEWFDARRELPGWTGTDFDDSDWLPAVELGPVGMAPWTTLEPSSVYHDVWSQSFFRVSGGMLDPVIQQAQPRLPTDDALISPLQNPQNLLHAHADPATLVPTPGYDAHL